MRALVECVPNFSEGRDRAVIDAIAEAIRDAPGCTLLDVDPGASTNRTVYTFVGPPDAVVDPQIPKTDPSGRAVGCSRTCGGVRQRLSTRRRQCILSVGAHGAS